MSEKIEQAPQVPKEEKFNFPEIEGLRRGLINICRKMKIDIEANKWDILVSDETGGRIPTLVIWNLIKKFHPEKPPRPFFISSGQSYRPKTVDDVFVHLDHFKKITVGAEKALLITQYIRNGGTMKSMISDLEMANIKKENIDVAGVVTHENDSELKKTLNHREGKAFAGTSEMGVQDNVVEAFYPKFTGVIQDRTKYSPVPIKLTESIKKTEKRGFLISESLWKEIFGIEGKENRIEFYGKVKDEGRNAEYDKRDKEPLSPEEEKALQENINKARQDVDTMAQAILKEVWGL